MANHRAAEKAAVLTDLRLQAQRLVEMAASVQIALKQITLWGGPNINDFGGENDPDAAARLTETIIALEGAGVVMASLNSQCPNYPGTTAGDAVMRIAKRL